MKDNLAGLKPAWLVRPLVWLADKMSGPLFIVEFLLFLVFWMAWNTFSPWRFDHAPFIGLNLFMSALAGIQCAVIGVKQTIADHRRKQAEEAHTARIDHIIEHIEQMEIDRQNDAKRREELQRTIVEMLRKG